MDDVSTDQELLERVVSGDTTAFWDLWFRHAAYVRRIICRQNHGDEDDVHDVMLKLIVKLPVHAAKISNLQAWMGKLAQNFCIDKHRAVHQRGDFVSLDEVELADPRSLRAEKLRCAPHVDHVMGNMSANLREAVALRFVQGLSYKQIAEQLKVPETRIRKRIERARKAMRRELGASC